MAMTFTKKEQGIYSLDVTGYVCPHPQIYTKKALEKIHGGDVLEVTFDNPSSSESVSAMCDSNGNEIIEKIAEGGKFTFRIKKA
ncbi:MAG: sulfurtransferase TusA family protein [Desulfobulbaceae bacterium]|jgi:tRNA 2-thiouridine synthesizing protein A|nr:sulfurtransferase TusA family protein [Desulfobulbaceae bacterium]